MSAKKYKHTYPPSYIPGPGKPWYLNKAWEILDTIKPGVIPEHVRAYLAGHISGALMMVAEDEKGLDKGP